MMRIEIRAEKSNVSREKEVRSKEYCREVVNVLLQYHDLVKDPGRKVNDAISFGKKRLNLSIIVFVFEIVRTIAGKGDIVCCAVVLSYCLISYRWLRDVEKMIRRYMEDGTPCLLTIDEEGVEFNKESKIVMRAFWNNIAFILILKESICFLSKDASGSMIAVPVDYKGQVLEGMREAGRTDILIRGY